MYKLLLLIGLLVVTGHANDCVPRDFGADSIVCVCNATYCDTLPENDPAVPEKGSYYWYVSSKDGLRLNFTKGKFNDGPEHETTLLLDSEKKYQKILGFGGAFTDSAGLNIKKLSEGAQEQLMRSYFSPKTGSGYTLGRVPIAGCDFSTRPYTYDDFSNDNLLTHFALAEEDYDYKIPFMKKAVELNPDMRFLSAAWTAPPWMKTNNDIRGFGFLKPQHYQTFADYLLKFIDQYKKEGVDIWAISTGNEPANVYAPTFAINKMGWTPGTVSAWVANNLGPTIESSNYNQTLILALDDQRFNLPWYIDRMFENEKAKEYTAGIAVHFYWDFIIPASRVDQVHERHPDKFILMTEACAGSAIWEHPKVLLGSWVRGEEYVLSIMENLNHWMAGWVDWNLALDRHGGPNWIDNYVDAPIIVNPETDEFYQQPMYYALKHFSRFVKKDSRRISITDTGKVKTIAFITPANEIVAVLYNRKIVPSYVTIKDVHRGSISLELRPYSLHTIVYKAW